METSEVFGKKITMEQSVNNIIKYTKGSCFKGKAKDLIQQYKADN